MVIIIAKVIVRVTEITNKNIHIYIYYKLGQAYITNWGRFFITTWDKCCYKSLQL